MPLASEELSNKARLIKARSGNADIMPLKDGLLRDTSHNKPDKERPSSLIHPLTDWLYIVALFLALFKDLLHLSVLGSLPAIGTVVTFIISISIGFILLATGALSKSHQLYKNFMFRIFLLGVGTLVEAFLFGLNLIPIQTITLILIYINVIFERKNIHA